MENLQVNHPIDRGWTREELDCIPEPMRGKVEAMMNHLWSELLNKAATIGSLNAQCREHMQNSLEWRRQRDEANAIIDRHDLCHDLHGKVGAKEFATGCEREQRKLYGCAPDADMAHASCFLLGAAAEIIKLLKRQQMVHDHHLDEKIKTWKQAVKNLLGS